MRDRLNIAQRFILVALLIISCSSQPGFSQRMGILIGLRSNVALTESLPYAENSEAAQLSTYRSFWLSFDAQDSISIQNLNNVIVPRNDGFWKIEVIRQKAGDWTEDRLTCSAINHAPTIPPLDSMTIAECEGNKRMSLIFVGSDFLSYEGSSDGYCQGAAHPWHVNYLKTVSLDDPHSDGVEISRVLSGEAHAALMNGARKHISRARDERLNPDPDERNWCVIRRRGKWILRGQLDYSAEVFRGIFAHFDIDLKPADHLVGFNELAVPWEKIKEMVPAARDAITSPDKKFAIALTKDKLLVYSIPELRRIKEIKLFPNEFIIMAQWADRSQVNDWNKVITDLLNR
jgi:hypothetical protein